MTTEQIKNQIPDELYTILTKTLPSERNQKKQLEIATQAMKQLDVEDFTPYIAYEDDGDIYVCLKHRLNWYELETIHASGKHDVSFGENGIWIEHDLLGIYEGEKL